MKNPLLLLAIILFGSYFSWSQTTLGAGDIAFIGYNADGPQDFAFVLLTDIDAGTIIKFTDHGWLNSTGNGFSNDSSDSIISWTATSTLTTGTIIYIDGTVTTEGSITSGSGLELNRFGDQIFAYQGTDDVNASFISGIHMNVVTVSDDANWDNSDAVSDGRLSNLPTSLTNGINALRVLNTSGGNPEVDNGIYNCINTNSIDIAALRTSINDFMNWNVDNFDEFVLNPFPCEFAQAPCPDITNFSVINPMPTSIDLTWDGSAEATNGYLIEVYNSNEDPASTTPVFMENVTAGNTTSTIISLTQYNVYDAYITADCGATNGSSETEMLTFEATSCPRVPSLFLNNVAETTAAIGWVIVPAASGGYPINIFLTGADPSVDMPVFSGTGAANTGGLFIENLTPATTYDAYVTSDCQAGGLSATESFSFTTLASCPIVTSLLGDTITDLSINLSWDDLPDAVNGFTIEVYNQGDNPNTTTPLITETAPAGTTNFMVTGLMAVTNYDIYVISICNAATGNSIREGISFRSDNAPFICGNGFFDPGGPFEDYPENFSGNVTISPDIVGDPVTVTFTYVDIKTSNDNFNGGCIDYLTLYDGPDTSSPVIKAFLCGEESGDGSTPFNPNSLLSIGDSFTSTHPTGALTFAFSSALGLDRESGWEADITCSTLSINEFNSNEFSLAPNPTNGQVTITSKNEIIDSLQVYDLLGKLVLDLKPVSRYVMIDLSLFKSGMYIVKTEINDLLSIKKLIKN